MIGIVLLQLVPLHMQPANWPSLWSGTGDGSRVLFSNCDGGNSIINGGGYGAYNSVRAMGQNNARGDTEPRLIFGIADKPIDSRAKRTDDNRRYPEKPELGQCPATGKQGHTGAAGRIYGGVRHRNTY